MLLNKDRRLAESSTYFISIGGLTLEILNHLDMKTLPRMLCNGNGVLPHFQMEVTVMGFVEDFRYSSHNS